MGAKKKKQGKKRKRNNAQNTRHTQKKKKVSTEARCDVGVYEIVQNTVATEGIARDSKQCPGKLSISQRVNVVEVKQVGDRIRAKLDSGGWISIESTCANHWVWAKHVGEPLFPTTTITSAAVKVTDVPKLQSNNGGIFTSRYLAGKKKEVKQLALKTDKAFGIHNMLFPPTTIKSPLFPLTGAVKKESLKISKEPEPLFSHKQEPPLAFMKPYRKILVLGEEDFSLSYDLSQVVRNAKITATEFASNFETTNFGKKLLALGHEIRNRIDATNIESFLPEDKNAYDACLFAFPRRMESIDHLRTQKYHELNEQFMKELLSTLFQLLKAEGRIFLVLMPTQVRLWNVEAHIKEQSWGMRNLGLFEFSRLMHYRPRNETGSNWEPYGSRVYEFASKPIDAKVSDEKPVQAPNPYLQTTPL